MAKRALPAAVHPRLYDRRLKMNLSLDDLARATGLAEDVIKECEAGKQHPSALRKIDRALRRIENGK